MRSTRRLARLEASLSPQQVTLLWLAEAHRFGSLLTYATSLLDQPTSMLPLVAVPQQARRAVRAAHRGQLRGVVAEAEQEAFREGLFLVQLVIELERAAQSTLRRAELRWLALWSEPRPCHAEGELPPEPTGTWRRAIEDLLTTISSAEEARSLLERRYLAGRDALFPDALAAWQELREAIQLLARRGRPSSSVGVKARAAADAAAIAETTRAASLALLGDSAAMVQPQLQSAPLTTRPPYGVRS